MIWKFRLWQVIVCLPFGCNLQKVISISHTPKIEILALINFFATVVGEDFADLQKPFELSRCYIVDVRILKRLGIFCKYLSSVAWRKKRSFAQLGTKKKGIYLDSSGCEIFFNSNCWVWKLKLLCTNMDGSFYIITAMKLKSSSTALGQDQWRVQQKITASLNADETSKVGVFSTSKFTFSLIIKFWDFEINWIVDTKMVLSLLKTFFFMKLENCFSWLNLLIRQ